jgi:hypothetical protein
MHTDLVVDADGHCNGLRDKELAGVLGRAGHRWLLPIRCIIGLE